MPSPARAATCARRSRPRPATAAATARSITPSRFGLDRQKRDLRRHAETYRDDAGADAGRHEEVTAVLDDVADRVALAETRRNDQPSDQGKGYLTAMGVAGNRQSDPVGNFREDVGIVGDNDDR